MYYVHYGSIFTLNMASCEIKYLSFFSSIIPFHGSLPCFDARGLSNSVNLWAKAMSHAML